MTAPAGGGSDSMTTARFMHAPTFYSLPYVGDDAVDVAVVGVPYDGGVTNRPGARHGPEAIRSASKMIRRVHHISKIAPFTEMRCADAGDATIRRWFNIEDAHADIEAFFRTLPPGSIPLAFGGDHSITIPILRVLGASQPLAVVHVDAHCDTGGAYGGSPFHHGAPFRVACEERLIRGDRCFQLGIRGSLASADQWSYSDEAGMVVVTIEDLYAAGIDAVTNSIRSALAQLPVYVSIDVDAMDPVYAPGTGTPEIGGLTSFEMLRLVRGLASLNVVGCDIVEVSPPFDVGGTTSLAAATIGFEVLCGLAARKRLAARDRP